jgi:DNA-directed RNA polymerase specialized sigma24 family protein
MGASERAAGWVDEFASSADIRLIHAKVVRTCLVTGLSISDAEDLAQDLFIWLLRGGSMPAIVWSPWLAAVVRNFIRRYWRRRSVRSLREARATVEARVFSGTDERSDSIEVRLSLDRIEKRLPEVEAALLRLVRRGCSFAEAVKLLEIPRGSKTFFRKRLIAHMAQGFGAATASKSEQQASPDVVLASRSRDARHVRVPRDPTPGALGEH